MITKEINGIKYEIKNKNDAIERYLLQQRQWNDGIFKYIIDLIEQKGLQHFLNVGCHIGTISLPVSKEIKQVSCVEAYPKTFSHLQDNIKLNNIQNIKCYNFALGNREEEIYFMGEDEICPIENKNRLKNNSGGNHVFTQKDIDDNIRSSTLTDKKVKNKMYRLDDTEIDNFDIMLVDIEGSEYDFLLGAKQKILKNNPIIIIEIWDDNKRNRENMKETRQDVIDLILSMDYQLVGSNGEDFLFHHSKHVSS